MHLRVALLQIEVTPGDKKTNLKRAEKLIEPTDAEIAILPEVFSTGFDYENLRVLAEDLETGESFSFLRRHSENRLIVGTVPEKREDKIYNTMAAFYNRRLIATYRKIHLFQREKKHFHPGERTAVFEYKKSKFGMAICYDIRFPELFRELVAKGAEVFLISSEFPAVRQEHYKILLRARAIENQCFVIACNAVGRDKYAEYSGGSLVISPWGEVLGEAGDKEELLEVEIDLGEVERIRKNFPVLEDSKVFMGGR